MKTLIYTSFAIFLFWGCTIDSAENPSTGDIEKIPSPSQSKSSSSTSSSSQTESLELISIPTAKLWNGVDSARIPSFAIAPKAFSSMDLYLLGLSKDSGSANTLLANQTWYQALLLCNQVSKIYGLDTVYQYQGISALGELKNVQIAKASKGYRLPTLAEWTIAKKNAKISLSDQEWLNDTDFELSKDSLWPITWDSTGSRPKILILPSGLYGSASPLSQLANRGFRLVRSL